MKATAVSADPRWRAEVYGLLALVFHRHPDADVTARIEACADTARGAVKAEIADALESLARHTRSKSATELKVEFNSLFLVPGPKYLAPYESVFVDAPIEANGKTNPRTYGPSTQQVMAFYRHIGLQVSRSYTELPDYVGLEFACMEYLCSREAAYSEEGNATAAQNAKAMQCVFLRDHLQKWVPPFAAKLKAKAETEYCRALSDLALAWVREESAPCQES